MVGANAIMSMFSYVALGRETVLGTQVTATSSMDFISCGFKTSKDSKILEELTRTRTYANRISLGKKIEGEIESYYYPTESAANWLMQNAFGGSVTAATVSAGASYTHEFLVGDIEAQTYKSLSVGVRKGDATTGKVFTYSGVRVNEFGLTGEMEEALKCNFGLIGMDATAGVDQSSVFTMTADKDALSFVGGRFSVEGTVASLTTSSFWHVQSVGFKLSNGLKADNDSRRIGSDVLSVLPVGIAKIELTTKMRFDTTTAYDAMLSGAAMSAEFEFLGSTLAGSATRRGIKLIFPKIYIKDAGDPEIGGPEEVLMSEVSFDVLRDASSTGGYAVKAIVTNGSAAI